jgi:arsenate reductase
MLVPVKIVYVYQKCSTCRDALKWLAARGIEHEIRAIRETPPPVDELRAALDASGGELKRLINTSGNDYRALGLKDKLPGLTETEVLVLLSQNGNLVKRPFLMGDGVTLNGFKPDVWEKAMG